MHKHINEYYKGLCVALTGLLLLGVIFPVMKTSALSGNEFQAGRIIDDAVFYNSQTMNAQQIQDFLNARAPVCDTNGDQMYGSSTRRDYSISRGYPPPFVCLKSYRQDVPTKAAETGLCNGVAANANRSSAQIIYDVAQSCGINPQVLLVLLQKEQILVTDDWPWPIQYRSATGYGCPDTAACDSQYYGFFNQVYNAARQFKYYALHSTSFNYRPNRSNYILYNPSTSCGGSDVYIQNQATANLYNYTPYQPNASALNNLYGTGDSCGAYGNRNFWRLFNEWFGSTYGDTIDPIAYRMYSPKSRDHSYSAKINDRNALKSQGFLDDGWAFNVSPTQEEGMIPIYRMYNGRLTDYWLVPDGMNRYWGIVAGGYRDDGIAFYAYPTNTSDPAQPCTQGIPVYQLWHGGIAGHFYSNKGGERYWAIVYAGYIDDKSAAYTNPANGAVSFCALP